MMKLYWVLMFLLLRRGHILDGVKTNHSVRPAMVNIGCMLSSNSVVNSVAKIALETAVADVNSNSTILGGTKLNIVMHESNFSGFQGIIETLRFVETEAVAIIGPGPASSVIAHLISPIVNELQVPLLSYAATDPTLSSPQYPFFIRTTINDVFQMAAIAEIIRYHGWRKVTAIYVDDDHGRNGIEALKDQLATRRCEISHKAPLKLEPTVDDIRDVLVPLALAESRILVVHTYADMGLDLFAVAKSLMMMESEYVWIATNWLTTVLDTNASLSLDARERIQGVVTLRVHTPDSQLKRDFVCRWRKLVNADMAYDAVGLNSFGLYAYDTIGLLAHAIDAFFKEGGNVSFSRYPRLNELRIGKSMSIFNGGNLLRRCILQVNMTGVTGIVKFTSDRELIHPEFEVINVIGTGERRVGYWSNYSGLSIKPPESLYAKPPNRSGATQKLNSVIWPGGRIVKPRGWVFPHNGRELRIGVPYRVSFHEFVGLEPGSNLFQGYCIDVFMAVLNLLAYDVDYKLLPYGDGHTNPDWTKLVSLITAGVFDAAIGDIAIITNRTRMVDFTQPYINSGLVVVAPIKKQNPAPWVFSGPFTPMMWCVTAVFFLIVGTVVWRKQIITILWFGFSTLFFSRRSTLVSNLAQLVVILWLFQVLIIWLTYTSNLASILTAQQLSSPIKGIESLLVSNDPIGYQQGSFARSYLVNELGICESRLVPLNLPEDYAKALESGPTNGGVAAIVDERGYAEIFLSTHCEYSIVGEEFARSGWGFVSSSFPDHCLHISVDAYWLSKFLHGHDITYKLHNFSFFSMVRLRFTTCTDNWNVSDKAFPRDSPLVADMSTAILKLSKNGDLERIHDKWLPRSPCSLQGAKIKTDRLELKSFSGLFFICGFSLLFSLLLYFIGIKFAPSRN